MVEGVFVSIKPGGPYANFVKAGVCAYMDAGDLVVNLVVARIHVSLMAVLL